MVFCCRDRQRQTESDGDRQTARQTANQPGRQTGWQGGRQGGRQTDRQAGREAGRQTDRQAGRQADRQTDRQAGRQTDRQPSARSSLRSCFEGVGAALWSWFLVGSEGNVSWFLVGSGACLLGATSVLQCHGVLLFRNRPLELRCGTVLRAWELHFGAGFLSVQKATLGSGACLLGAASVLQCHGVLLFRNRPQATESVEKCCFSRISDDTFFFGGVVLERARPSARPSEAWCFAPGR